MRDSTKSARIATYIVCTLAGGAVKAHKGTVASVCSTGVQGLVLTEAPEVAFECTSLLRPRQPHPRRRGACCHWLHRRGRAFLLLTAPHDGEPQGATWWSPAPHSSPRVTGDRNATGESMRRLLQAWRGARRQSAFLRSSGCSRSWTATGTTSRMGVCR